VITFIIPVREGCLAPQARRRAALTYASDWSERIDINLECKGKGSKNLT
jgi:hypothetical protein